MGMFPFRGRGQLKMADVGQIPIKSHVFLRRFSPESNFWIKRRPSCNLCEGERTLLALHWSATIFTGEVWKTSKNDFSNRECPNIGRVRESLQGCKDVCMVKQGCTGFNYNHKTRSCVMRGCSLPVKRPARNYHDGYNAFWLASTTSGSCKYVMSSKKTSVSYGNFSF